MPSVITGVSGQLALEGLHDAGMRLTLTPEDSRHVIWVKLSRIDCENVELDITKWLEFTSNWTQSGQRSRQGIRRPFGKDSIWLDIDLGEDVHLQVCSTSDVDEWCVWLKLTGGPNTVKLMRMQARVLAFALLEWD